MMAGGIAAVAVAAGTAKAAPVISIALVDEGLRAAQSHSTRSEAGNTAEQAEVNTGFPEHKIHFLPPSSIPSSSSNPGSTQTSAQCAPLVESLTDIGGRREKLKESVVFIITIAIHIMILITISA
jgi:hypothetical protein